MALIHFIDEINKSTRNLIKGYLKVLVSPIFFKTKMFCFCSVSRFFSDSFNLMVKMLNMQRNFNFEKKTKQVVKPFVKPFEKVGIVPIYDEAAAVRN